MREIETEASKTRGDYACTIWEQCYVSEPIEPYINYQLDALIIIYS